MATLASTALCLPILAQLFRSVHDGVNRLFNQYMARKGHLGSIKLDTDAQTLQLKVGCGSSRAVAAAARQQ